MVMKQYITKGWPNCKEHQRCRNDLQSLQLEEEVIWRFDRIVVPMRLRSKYVNEIHYRHPGVEHTLWCAREYMFWPKMNQEIKEKVLLCETSLKYRSKQPLMEMLSHQIPSSPYERVGLDLLELSM
jgi:hypothetical protein